MSDWAEKWASRRSRAAVLTREGRVVMSPMGSRIHIAAPYNEEFNKRARELMGRWRYRTKVWSFPGPSRRLLLELIVEIYGPDALCK